MRTLFRAIVLSLIFLSTTQAQENLDNPPQAAPPLETVALGDLLDDNYEIKTTVVNMLILQKKKSAYACNMVARTLADVQNWLSADCVDIGSE